MSAEDYSQFADALDQVRENLSAMVAGLIADGFTEEQAREVAAAFMAKAARST